MCDRVTHTERERERICDRVTHREREREDM